MTIPRPSVLLAPTSAFADAVAPAPGAAWNTELPNTSVELLIELDSGWELDLDGHRTRTRSFAAGLVAGPVRTRADGPVRLVQLSLDPLQTLAVFGVPAGELAATACELEDLLGSEAERLRERVHAAGGGDAGGIATAETWLVDRLNAMERDRAPAAPADVARACTLMRAAGGTMRVGAVAEQLGCSRRHLTRRFIEFVGVGPSQFNQLVRFGRATTSLRRTPAQALGALAHASGYADQSHMNRDFQAFTGATPSAVAARFV